MRRLLSPLCLVIPLLTAGQAPTVQDCLGAIPVCEPVYYTTNSYTGHGNVYPEIHNTGVCPLCMDGEKNDVFYTITVQTAGILRFTLTPNNPSNDYDWSLFNMTNADCDQIYTQATQLQVSCNSYGVLVGQNGPTGINTALGNQLNCNGPGNANGPPFNKDLPVLAGETYVLNISNWSSSNQSGYTLDFSASTATIFDNVPPVIDSIQQEIPCSGTTELYVRFSENVLCDDVFQHPEKFTLTGPAGAISITDVGSAGCATGANQSPGYTLYVSPELEAGSYTLSIAGDINDLCGNLAVYQGYPFTLTGINAPWAGAGNDTTVANGAVVTLHGSAGGGTGPYTWHWEPASLLVDPDVQNPVTLNMGATTQFTVTVTDGSGCTGQDDVVVTVVGGPLGVTATADPGSVCRGASATLHAIPTGGSGNYTYSWTSVPAGFSSSLPDPVVQPVSTTNYSVTINDGFSMASSGTQVVVHPLPVAEAGSDFSIPHGTAAQLSGSASGGSGSYFFQWTSEPPGYTGNVANPVFYNLQQTTVFTLTVTDLSTGCLSIPDPVVVTVTGSPLACSPMAIPHVVCRGHQTILYSMAGGGSGNYSFHWTSDPPGFESTLPAPVVTPLLSTTYFLEVGDGFNTVSGQTAVQVDPVPVIHLGPPDTVVCIFDTLRLDAGNEGSQFVWSNGATTRTILVTTTGIGYDLQYYSVLVTNGFLCSDSASIQVTFSYDACTGTNEMEQVDPVIWYPNPVSGTLKLRSSMALKDASITIMDIKGRQLRNVRLTSGNFVIFAGEIDIDGLVPGFYLLHLKTEDFSGVYRFVVIR